MGTGRTTNITTKKIVNPDTGEVSVTEKEETVRYGKTADFVMTFTKDLGYMKHLSKGEIFVMLGFIQIVNKDNEVILNPTIKQRIAKQFDLKLSSINQLISNLAQKQMIFKPQDGGRGVYKLNTFLFGKGDWTTVKKQRMYIEWDFKSLTKKVMVEQDYLTEEEQLEKQMQELQVKKDLITKEKLNQTPNLFDNEQGGQNDN